VGDAIAHRAEKGGSILHENEVALLVHSPHKIGELYLREVLQTESTWKSDFIKGAIYGRMVLDRQTFFGSNFRKFPKYLRGRMFISGFKRISRDNPLSANEA